MSDRTVSRVAWLAPPSAKTSFPAVATGLPPKTGAARNDASWAWSCFAAEAIVSGWTVEQSMKIFSRRDCPDEIAVVMRLERTASLETYTVITSYPIENVV
jgi:hypothetical protein